MVIQIRENEALRRGGRRWRDRQRQRQTDRERERDEMK